MRYQFIQTHQESYPISLMCQVLQVSRSGYYAWRNRKPSQRQMANEELGDKIEEIHTASRGTYGILRIYYALLKLGYKCGRHRVARLMRQRGLDNKKKRSYKRTTQSNHAFPVADNVLNQQFQTAELNQIWASDITYIPTAEGWLYLAVVIDLCSRLVVGWSMKPTLHRSLTLDALKMALGQRSPSSDLIHHSDRGSQYASTDYQRLLSLYQVQVSMSRRGNCYDNAPVESFFGSLKTEEVQGQVYPSRHEARLALFDYIEVFYNRQRLHSSLGYMSPFEFEQAKTVS